MFSEFLNRPTEHASQCIKSLGIIWLESVGLGVGLLFLKGVCALKRKTWMGLILLGTG